MTPSAFFDGKDQESRIDEAEKDPVRKIQAEAKLAEKFREMKAKHLAALLQAQRDKRSSEWSGRMGPLGTAGAGIANLMEGRAETLLGPEMLSRAKESVPGNILANIAGTPFGAASFPSGSDREQITRSRKSIEERAMQAAKEAYEKALLGKE